MHRTSALLAALTTLSLAIPAAAVEGTYRNNMKTTLKVTKRGPAYRASIELAWPGCLGSVEGPARLRNNVMVLRGHDPSVGETCEVQITFTGNAATLREQGGCLAFHGARCGFEGTVRR